MPVLAATTWPTNSHLVADCAQLGYLQREWLTLDPTFGLGRWWLRWWPETLIAHDKAMDGVDFRDLPHDANTFDAVAYDPPYVCIGGRETTGIADMYGRYGQMDTPKSPAQLQLLINTGLLEMHRVCKPRGFVLVKCQDYVSSGKLWLGTHHTLSYGIKLGFEVVDRMEMVTSTRPQPPGRRQVHARRNLSTLFVLKKRA